MKTGKGVLAAVSLAIAMVFGAGGASATTFVKAYNVGQLAGGDSGSVSDLGIIHPGPYDLFISFKLTTKAKVYDVFSTEFRDLGDSVSLFAGGGPCMKSCSGGTLVPGAGATGSGSLTTPWTNTLDKGRYYFEVLTGPFAATKTNQFSFLDTVYTSAVPEPATWSMMILGVGLMGASLRRRARKLTAVAAQA